MARVMGSWQQSAPANARTLFCLLHTISLCFGTGRLTVQYNTGPSKDSFGGRHGSLIGLLSGSLGFKKMFDEQRTSRNFAEGKRSSRNFEETDRRGSVDDQETRGPQGVSIDMGSPRVSILPPPPLPTHPPQELSRKCFCPFVAWTSLRVRVYRQLALCSCCLHSFIMLADLAIAKTRRHAEPLLRFHFIQRVQFVRC